MSAIRDSFFEKQAAAALWDVAVSLKRGNPLPLDANSVFESYAALETYAAGVLAYPGQIVAVVNADSTGIYYLDQNLAIQEVGKIPVADEASIEVNNNVISMHDFGKAYYKYIAEDAESKVAAHYEKVEVSDTNVWAAGLEPKVVSENGQLVLGWFEPNPTTVDGVQDQVVAVQGTVSDLDNTVNGEGGLVDQVESLQYEIGHAATETGNAATGLYAELDTKANAEEVDTALAEVNEAIAAKANAADVYTKAQTDSQIATAVAGADHLKRKIVADEAEMNEFIANNSDTADQYIFMVPIEGADGANKYHEYALIEGVVEQVGNWEVDLSNYYTKTEVDNALADQKTELEGSITGIQSGIATTLENYVQKEEGKVLVAADEVEKLASVQAGAQPNYITTVSADFNVTGGELTLNTLAIDDVDGLQGALDAKAATADLATWVENNRNTVNGLFSEANASKLAGIEAGAQVNYIKAVDTDAFSVVDGTLAFGASFNTLKQDVTTLQSSLADTNVKVGNLEGSFTTLNEALQAQGARVTTLETAVTGENGLNAKVENIIATYATTASLETAVAELEAADKALAADIATIQEILTWVDMTEGE